MKKNLYIFFLLPFISMVSPADAGSGMSLDCASAQSDVEIEICSDDNLKILDQELTLLYNTAQKSLSQNQKRSLAFQKLQQSWVQLRDRCNDTVPNYLNACLTERYASRITSLRTTFRNLYQRYNDQFSAAPKLYYCDEDGSYFSLTAIQTIPALFYFQGGDFQNLLELTKAYGEVIEFENRPSPLEPNIPIQLDLHSDYSLLKIADQEALECVRFE